MDEEKLYGEVKGPYTQTSISKRIEALFLDNIGKILTREQIIQVAIDPVTGRQPENWHQRLSELRTDVGYTILSWRNRGWLNVEEYLMPTNEKRKIADKRIRPTDKTWIEVLENANYACQWNEDGNMCKLQDGDIDPIGGGTVKLTPDHKNPHSLNPSTDRTDASQWQVLCGRHQVTKKNYWD
ncbi:MAG: restriction endonuclease, partial [Calditrichaeota bacterium]